MSSTGIMKMDEILGDQITRSEDYLIMRDILASFEEDIEKRQDTEVVLFERTGIPGEMLMQAVEKTTSNLMEAIASIPFPDKLAETEDQMKIVLLMTAFIHGMGEGRSMKHGSTLYKKLEEALSNGVDPTEVAIANIDKSACENISRITAIKQVVMINLFSPETLKFPMTTQVILGFLVGWEFDSLRRTRRVFREAADAQG
jgi:hypothetical protein